MKYGKACKFYGCCSKSKRHPHKKFFPFVKPWIDRDRCLRWILATGREDLQPVLIDKYSYVCSDHFLDGAPTEENPDPQPYPYIRITADERPGLNHDPLPNDFQGNHGYSGQADRPVTLSPAQQAAARLKKKALSPKIMLRKNRHPYRAPSSKSEVIDVNKDGVETFPKGHPVPPTNQASSTGNTSTYLQLSDDVATMQFSKEKAIERSSIAPSEKVRSLQRRLFEEFVDEMSDNVTDANVDMNEEGISSLDGSVPQPTSISTHRTRREESEIIESGSRRSIGTQTWSKSFVNRLIAAGKLSKWGESSSTKMATVKTVNSGGNITIVRSENEADDIEGGGRPSENEVGGPNLSDSDEEEERIPYEEEDAMPREVEECGNAEGKPKHREALISLEKLDSDKDFQFLCGLSKQHFELVYDYIGGDDVCSHLKYECEAGTPKRLRHSRLSYRNRLFMTLCRLRRGFTEMELAVFFGCSETLVSRILNTWINFLFLEFKPLEPHMFQDRKSQQKNMPSRFKSFKGLRVVVDCTEIEIESPSNFQQQGNQWSPYKHSNTIKFLIGINTRGAIIYVSEAFEGSMSDKEVFLQSSLYEMLKPGDVVMADRGFDIAHELDLKKVSLVIPSYLKGRDYLTAEEEIWTKKIARARIFVENAIGRLKMWRLLSGRFTQSTLHLVSQMVFICACLTNFQPPLL